MPLEQNDLIIRLESAKGKEETPRYQTSDEAERIGMIQAERTI